MESLKPLGEVLEPDERQHLFVTYDATNGRVLPPSLPALHARAAEIRLHDGVPPEIRSHFATAVNLVIYSWFFYPFNATAQLMGFVSVELALKRRYPDQKRANFKALVRHAVQQGHIKPERFRHWRNRRSAPDETAQATAAAGSPALTAYEDVLIDAMPSLRNMLAHGSEMVHWHGARSVEICADFINQLFPETGGTLERS